MTWFSLALAQLRHDGVQTLAHVGLMALGVAVIAMTLLAGRQFEERLTDDAEEIDLVVGASGSPLQLILSSVYHVDAPIGNVPGGVVAALDQDRRVARATPIALGDSVSGYRLVGAPVDYLALFDARTAEGRAFEKTGEAVVGDAVARALDLEIGDIVAPAHGLGAGAGTHDHAALTVVGRLAPTGKVIDRLVVTPIESVWAAHGVETAADADHDDHEHGDHDHSDGDHEHGDHKERAEVTAILVKTASPLGNVTLPDAVEAAWPGVQVADPARETVRLLVLIEPAMGAVRLLAVVIMGAAALSVFGSMAAAMRRRVGEAALLRAMGAGRADVTGQLICEGALVSAIGAALGLVIAHGGLALLAGVNPDVRAAGVDGGLFLASELAVAVAAVALGALAALIPALRAYGVDAAKTLSESS